MSFDRWPLTLIKSVLYSIPIYPLSVRILPIRVRNIHHVIMSRFLWRGTNDRRKLHLVSWDKITKAWNSGGLGVTVLGEMNAALLVSAKSGSNPRSLSMAVSSRSRKSTLVSLVGSLLDKDENISQIVSESFRLLIRNGQN